MHNADQRVAVWLTATGRIVHAMVASGYFGPKDRTWVAVCYLGVLIDLCARFSFKGAALYDRAIREMGDNDPYFGTEQALPFYKGLHMDTLSDVKLRNPTAFAVQAQALAQPRSKLKPPLPAPPTSHRQSAPRLIAQGVPAYSAPASAAGPATVRSIRRRDPALGLRLRSPSSQASPQGWGQGWWEREGQREGVLLKRPAGGSVPPCPAPSLARGPPLGLPRASQSLPPRGEPSHLASPLHGCPNRPCLPSGPAG